MEEQLRTRLLIKRKPSTTTEYMNILKRISSNCFTGGALPSTMENLLTELFDNRNNVIVYLEMTYSKATIITYLRALLVFTGIYF